MFGRLDCSGFDEFEAFLVHGLQGVLHVLDVLLEERLSLFGRDVFFLELLQQLFFAEDEELFGLDFEGLADGERAGTVDEHVSRAGRVEVVEGDERSERFVPLGFHRVSRKY